MTMIFRQEPDAFPTESLRLPYDYYTQRPQIIRNIIHKQGLISLNNGLLPPTAVRK